MERISPSDYLEAEPEERRALLEDRLQQVGVIARVGAIARFADDLKRLKTLKRSTERAAMLKAWAALLSIFLLIVVGGDIAVDGFALWQPAFRGCLIAFTIASLVTFLGWVRERNLRRAIVRLCDEYED